MIVQISIGTAVSVLFDDEITDERPTPEVVEDYITRIRQQALVAYMALPAIDELDEVAADVSTGDDD